MPHIEIAAEKIYSILGFAITNTLVNSIIASLFLTIFAVVISRRIKLFPSAPQNIFEMVVEKLLGMMENIFESRAKAEKFFPLVATIFIFILTSNWLGILPGVGSVGLIEKTGEKEMFIPLFRSAASDLNFTLGLAIVAVISVNLFGIISIGIGKHFSKFVSFKGPIDFFVGILELISEIAKMISFAFRLFGNVFAGEVLLIITAFLVPYVVPVPFLMLEIFVGFIQALVFAMLTMVFISLTVSHH